MSFNTIIMGAAGRDFHDFRTFFQERAEFHVVAFTAAQIPFIDTRVLPPELAGRRYPEGIPIHPEAEIETLIRALDVDFVFLAYSDLPYHEVMAKAARVQASGAAFGFLGPRQTQLESRRPVLAITATRTGAGKSPVTQHLARWLAGEGISAAVIRHPMPYGDLGRERVQRFASFADLEEGECTIEEREEYEPYVRAGLSIYAGVDYAAILEAAESDAEVILWDGGNNDFSFIRPTLSIVVTDALRPGDEISYYPSEVNLIGADAVLINKVGGVASKELDALRQRISARNPGAEILEGDLVIELDAPDLVRGKRALVIEDGPTLTHGGMAFGAGTVAAKRYGAAAMIDPRPHAVGSISRTFQQYPHIESVLPALGYSAAQRAELKTTIEASGAEVVIDASPADIDRLLDLEVPVVRVRYRFQQVAGTPIEELVRRSIGGEQT
ncbi:MAG: GTPase [Gammaproteobacteria bacterium]|jgi:predicted GTPase